MKPKLRWAAFALLAIVAVFWLKVWHAEGVCAEFHGRWDDGECHFDEMPAEDLVRGPALTLVPATPCVKARSRAGSAGNTARPATAEAPSSTA